MACVSTGRPDHRVVGMGRRLLLYEEVTEDQYETLSREGSRERLLRG